MLRLIDTHCHLDRYNAADEITGVLTRATQAEVERMIAIGTAPDDWAIHAALAGRFPARVSHTIGIHPCNVDAAWEEAFAQLPRFLKVSPAPVAIGETGLDRFHLPKDDAAAAETLLALQRASFAAHLALVRECGLPLVVHSRNAFEECVAMIDASGVDWRRVVFHCFSEGEKEMQVLKARGGRASFTGIITYKNADNVRAALLAQGLETLMLETDAPFLAPDPFRGKPNEPAYLAFTAAAAARLLKVSLEELAEKTTRNARAFFRIA